MALFIARVWTIMALCSLRSGFAEKRTRKESNIYAVMDEVFEGYKPYARPVKSSDTATVVNVSFNIMGIKSLDEKRQTMSQSLFMNLQWFDHHLVWNETQHGGLDHLVVPQKMLWLPDIIVTPFAGRMQRLGYDEMTLIVESSGKVTWQPSGLFTTHCDIDITYYPFDTQLCLMRLELWASSTEDTLLSLSISQPVDREDFAENSEWQLLKLEVQQLNETVSQEVSVSEVVLHFTLRRRPMFVTLTIELPTLLLGLLSTAVFALPPESGEKMSVCVTVFLTTVLTLSLMLKEMPHSSLQISIHVTYLALLATSCALSVLLSLFVVHLDHRSRTGQPVGACWSRFVLCVRRYKQSKLRNTFCTETPGQDRENSGDTPKRDLGSLRFPNARAPEGTPKDSITNLLTSAAADISRDDRTCWIPRKQSFSTCSAAYGDHPCLSLKAYDFKNYSSNVPDRDNEVLKECHRKGRSDLKINVVESPIQVDTADPESNDQIKATDFMGHQETVESVQGMKAARRTTRPEMTRSANEEEVAGQKISQAAEATRKEKKKTEEEISWKNVAESLDFVLFRCFLSFVVMATVVFIIFMMVQFKVTREWP